MPFLKEMNPNNFIMSSKIKAAIRIRPFLKSEVKNGYTNSCIASEPGRKEVQVYEGQQSRNFNFDYILPEQASQEDVYQTCGIEHMIEKSLQGYHATIFAYGQTGSGKTHTMHGDESQANSGLIPKIFHSLCKHTQNNSQRAYSLSISFLQIYNEKIYDLLNPAALPERLSAGLKLRWNKDEQFSVENLYIFECMGEEDLKKYFQMGLKNRISAAHKLNLQSSRSHSILTIRIDSYDRQGEDGILSSKLELVDLAGSERIGQTGTEGKQAKESIDINKSLFTLRQVISILAQTSRGKGKQKVYVPYRDSKLTSILKQSIGGNSYCLMIACICPNDYFLEENLSTLTYATKASYITNQPIVNDDPRTHAINELKSQLKAVTQELGRANQHIDMLTHMKDSPAQVAPNHNNFFNKGNEQNQGGMIKRGYSQRESPQLLVNGGEAFSERLVESINMVRQLLKSNKELRQKLQLSNQRNDQKDTEIFQLSRENEHLKEKMSQSHEKRSPTHSQTAIRSSSSMTRKRQSSQAPRVHQETQPQLLTDSQFGGQAGGQVVGFSGGGSRNNFNYWNSVEINQYYMNQRGVDSVPTNFSRKEVASSQERRLAHRPNERPPGRQALTAKLSSRNWKQGEANKFLSFYQQHEMY